MAQLVAHLVWDQRVASSSLVTPTGNSDRYGRFFRLQRAEGRFWRNVARESTILPEKPAAFPSAARRRAILAKRGSENDHLARKAGRVSVCSAQNGDFSETWPVSGPGPLLPLGPSPAYLPSRPLQAIIGGPGPAPQIGPSPKTPWTWSTHLRLRAIRPAFSGVFAWRLARPCHSSRILGHYCVMGGPAWTRSRQGGCC